jgi:hypothetical protein
MSAGREKMRGFDTPELYRKDTLNRIRHLELEVEERAKVIGQIESRLPPHERCREEEDEECE